MANRWSIRVIPHDLAELNERRVGLAQITQAPIRHLMKATLIALGLVPSACLIDTDDPCRDNEVFDEVTFVCACRDGYALTPDGCTKCGKHEVVSGNACVCKSGYAKAGTDSTCKEVEEPAPPTGDAGSDPASSDAEPTQLSAEGEGTACTSDAACANFPDANVCDTFIGACSIKNCSIDPDNCPDTYLCCDVSAFAPGAPNVCIKDACP